MSSAESLNTAGRLARLVVRDIAALRPHAAYLAVVGPPSVTHVAEVARQSGALNEPLLITQDGTIVDGHARWQAAKVQGLTSLACLEHTLTDEEALAMVIARHSRSDTLNAFCRVALALRLEPHFKRTARARLEASSSPQRPSSLTNPDRLDVRRDIARVAGVSTGNVTKVKQLLEAAIPDVLAALRQGTVSIHQAWQWRQLSRKGQRSALWGHQHRTAIDHTIRRLITEHTRAKGGTAPVADVAGVFDRLSARAPSLLVVVADLPGEAVVLTRDLYESLL